jgi:hypothetical protein
MSFLVRTPILLGIGESRLTEVWFAFALVWFSSNAMLLQKNLKHKETVNLRNPEFGIDIALTM